MSPNSEPAIVRYLLQHAWQSSSMRLTFAIAMIHNPLFLIGAERSGTTLMRLMLDSHPDVAFAEEFEYAVSQIADDGTFPEIQAYGEFLSLDRIFSTSGFKFDPSKSYPELVNGFLEQRQQAKGAEQVGATVHFGFAKIPYVWPDARFIHMVRDPRDVARSCVGMGWAGNVWFGLDKWMEADNEWGELQKHVDPDRVFTIKFSDLVGDHETVLKGLCEFIGVDYTDRMLTFADETDYGVPNPERARSWRSDMSKLDVRLIETRLGQRLAARGYEPSGLAPVPNNRVVVEALRAHSRIVRVIRRARFFGPRLVAQQLLARLTGDEERQREIRLRFNDIELTHIDKSWAENSDVRSSR